MYKEIVEGIGKEHDVIENVYWCMLIMCVWKACVWQSCLWKNCVWDCLRELCVTELRVTLLWVTLLCVWHCPRVKGLCDNFACEKIEGTPLLSLSATHACHPNVPWRTPSATLATQKRRGLRPECRGCHFFPRTQFDLSAHAARFDEIH